MTRIRRAVDEAGQQKVRFPRESDSLALEILVDAGDITLSDLEYLLALIDSMRAELDG